MCPIRGDNQGVVTLCDAAGVLVHVNQKILHYSCGIGLLGIIIAYINLTSYHSPILRKQKTYFLFSQVFSQHILVLPRESEA